MQKVTLAKLMRDRYFWDLLANNMSDVKGTVMMLNPIIRKR